MTNTEFVAKLREIASKGVAFKGEADFRLFVYQTVKDKVDDLLQPSMCGFSAGPCQHCERCAEEDLRI